MTEHSNDPATPDDDDINPFEAMRDHAVDYATNAGFAIIPLWPAQSENICLCPKRAACKGAGKHPVVGHQLSALDGIDRSEPSRPDGVYNATTDPELIARWWNAAEQVVDKPWNIGIATGRASGLVVIDIDTPEAGDAVAAMFAEHGDLDTYNRTRRHTTGKLGCYHVLFDIPEDWAGACGTVDSWLPDNVNMRGDGGLIVAPPSEHATGRTYGVADESRRIEYAPQWALEAIAAAEAAKGASGHDVDLSEALPEAQSVVERVPDKVVELIRAPVPAQGKRSEPEHAILAGLVEAGLTDAEIRSIAPHVRVIADRAADSNRSVDVHVARWLQRNRARFELGACYFADPAWGVPADVLEGYLDQRHAVDETIADVIAETAPPNVDPETGEILADGRQEPIEGWPGIRGKELDDLVAAVMSGEYVKPEPEIGLCVDGGPGLFYRGKTHTFFGTSSSGKSLLLLRIAIEQMMLGRDVLWIDVEDIEATSVVRLIELGCDPGLIGRHMMFRRPDTGMSMPDGKANRDVVAPLLEDLEERDLSLVIVDSLGVYIPIAGREDRDEDVARTMDDYVRMFADRGAAVVFIDHVPKNGGHKPAGPIGSQRKLSQVSGSAFRVTATKPFSSSTSGGGTIVCVKDRGGNYTVEETSMTYSVDTDADRGTPPTLDDVKVTLHRPRPEDDDSVDARTTPDGEVLGTTVIAAMRKVSLAVSAADEPLSQAKIAKATGLSVWTTKQSLEHLEAHGYVTVQAGKRGANLVTHEEQFNSFASDRTPGETPFGDLL